MKAYREYNLSPETLWNMVLPEVTFIEFRLPPELEERRCKELAHLKRTIMYIALDGGGKHRALKAVYQYNRNMNEILAGLFEPVRDDFQVNVPVQPKRTLALAAKQSEE